MNSTVKTWLPGLVLYVSLILVPWQQADAGTVKQRILQCALLESDNERLACFDAISADLMPKDSNISYIKPAQEFLDAEIRVDPEISEYSLTVKDLINMMHSAVVDEEDHINVKGWEQKGSSYQLHFVMRQNGHVDFEFHKGPGSSFALIKSAMVANEPILPAQFIFVIAAMVPDTK